MQIKSQVILWKFKTGKKGLTATYVPSAAIAMILALQSPFELSVKYYIERA